MDKQQKIIISIVAAILVALLVAVTVVAMNGNKSDVGDFVPPPFEENAVSGIPDPLPANFGTIAVNPEFVFGACAFPSLEGSSLEVCLASHANNTCWVKIRIYDESGSLLGESGLLKPGEYLPTLDLADVPENTKRLFATVLAYQPDTYYSEGSVDIELQIAVEQ